eukprot:scaffold214435_cov17-Prasinocladus_malaysianus.AAC.1
MERKWRSLTEMIRAMLHHFGLHAKYLGHAIQTAAHIRNRIFHPSVNGIPYELLTSSKVDMLYIRVFGCPCHVHLDSARRSKLQDTVISGFLVGYADAPTTYLVQSIATSCILVANGIHGVASFLATPTTSYKKHIVI